MDLPAAAKRVYLVRHAEAAHIGDPWAMDSTLTARGEAQLDALRKLAPSMPVDAVICSELVRARHTADAIASAHGLVPSIDAEWNELHTVGAWREHSASDVEALLKVRLFRPDDRGPIGESLRALHVRVTAAWQRILAQPARNIVLVSHHSVLGALIQAIMGRPEDADRTSAISYPHTGISELWLLDRDYDPSLPGLITVVVRMGDVSHLSPELVTR